MEEHVGAAAVQANAGEPFGSVEITSDP